MSWNDERVDLLKKLWSDGLSASQIAAELGGVTRNAVIGKVHRLGLSGRAKSSGQQSAIRAKRGSRSRSYATRPRKSQRALANTGLRISGALRLAAEINGVELVAPEPLKLALVELTERTCKWPIGDPSTSDFYFCGLQCAPDKPYCSAHVSVAYQPMSSRRDRDRSRTRAASA